MSKNQKIALAISAVNLLLILLLPPFDQYSIAKSKIPVFAGFHFVLNPDQHSVINSGVLTLEVIVVLINTGIAWLLLKDRPPSATRRKIRLQNATLVVTGINLVVILLFPPFESVFELTNAAIPTLEGFYFITTRHPHHTIVTALLYLEEIFILINGALFWLLFKERRQLTPEDVYALAGQVRPKNGR